MAQLKDLIVNGPARLVGDVFTVSLQVDTVKALTSSAATSYGVGTTDQLLASNGTKAYWKTLTIPTYTAATTVPPNVSTTSSVGASTNYARQDHIHAISLASGDSNGQVKIAGTNVSVKGLGSAAYTSSGTYATPSSVNSAISSVVSLIQFEQGTDASGNPVTGAIKSKSFSYETGEATIIITQTANGRGAFAEGGYTVASGDFSHAEGFHTIAIGENSHAEGDYSTSEGYTSHAEGQNTVATGDYSHVEGQQTYAEASWAHAEGNSSWATGIASHAEGGSSAGGSYSHSEGWGSWASGDYSHSEGSSTASGNYSHSEGQGSASGENSHAEGYDSTALGDYSHVEGYYTSATHKSQHVFGEYNISDPSSATSNLRGTYVEIVGNGVSGAPSNARTLDWSGNETIAGNFTVANKLTLEYNTTTDVLTFVFI